ncbi:hypothetical protein [Cytobacillus horneckiae]|uniref:Type II secretion system protein GspF domain-containing protein n=1 Tax=Cytobacillus horneckiae TaxID=549687 RepID=A0A2N0Z8D2_9BACI|nr:hypothetical protein [Cytobacillus horneckiae]MEC1158679.1 hypothetical protein [Cytobacillus horneckiae]NRG44035.1 hypothetical protein [Bacillus sp. CRN 9]PKG25766.1 hypothetical protein CWS20_27570 [Cytobacillus horneckiae]
MKIKIKLEPVLKLFSVIQVILYALLIYVFAAGYLYLTTNHLVISLSLAGITAIFSFYHSVYIPKKVKYEQYLMKEIQKYASTMTFYLHSGNNVMQSLISSKASVDPIIQEDIDLIIRGLEEEAVLKTDHFKKYKFSGVDIFHQNLRIKYEIGGNAKQLFNRVNKAINFEIVKRDELFKEKKYIKQKIFMMIAMVLAMPLILRFFVGDVYSVYLQMGILPIANTLWVFIAVLISLYFVQKTAANTTLVN